MKKIMNKTNMVKKLLGMNMTAAYEFMLKIGVREHMAIILAHKYCAG